MVKRGGFKWKSEKICTHSVHTSKYFILYNIYICNDIDKRNFKICIFIVLYTSLHTTNTKFVTYIVHPCNSLYS